MIKTFTQKDLVRYLYRETTEEEKTEIDRALLCDTDLMALYKELCSVTEALDKVRLEPSAVTVQNILAYSRHTQQKGK